ncbi:MAG: sigma-70 family RNA polymerase sigma factor [Pirellulaceae bacterium]|nr:sigma-70 family RNA polymerase sigma factor [Planctomycetales bacterium]
MSREDQQWREWIDQLVDGQNDAVTEFWNEFGPRLQALAAKHLTMRMRVRAEPEDIVQSACRTFFRRAQEGQFEMPDSDQLWRLLYAITLTKTREYARFHSRQKRGVDKEQRLSPPTGKSSFPGMDFAGAEPTPEEAAQFADDLEGLLSALDDEERQLVNLKLQQYTNDEIAQQMNCSERTVRRILQRVRTRLRDILNESR